jgi:hypothetical protein
VKRLLILLGMVFTLAGCDYEEIEVETGYKGQARRNPWLAAERFTAAYGFEVESLTTWREPEGDDSVWLVPASVLNNELYVRKAAEWAREGGHLVVLLEHAGAEVSDWRTFNSEVEVEPALTAMLARAGITLTRRNGPERHGWFSESVLVNVEDAEFRVEAGAGQQVAAGDGKAGVFATVASGAGRISVLADARILRNRWLGDADHAALLLALIDVADFEGSVCFSRGSSLSFWGMVKRHLWAVLTGLAACLAVWLWKSLVRFGPLEPAHPPDTARSYDHHLAALGGFHWRISRATDLLAPLRERIHEQSLRLGHRAGRTAEELHQWLAARSGLPAERVARALAEAPPADGAALTRITADLQLLHRLLS